jgi:phosphopentomutase
VLSQKEHIVSDKFNGRRAIVLIIDGCGIGASPDAPSFGDGTNCNTLSNLAERMPLDLPILGELGLGNITHIKGVAPLEKTVGSYGKLEEASRGKDTQTGHWELMGLVSNAAFPLYPKGFPPEVLDRFIEETGCKQILGNKPASGTDILNELGPEHQKTGYPIVYTSGDSVFQIACDTATVPLETLYEWSRIARRILDGEHRVGRVIARPFVGEPSNYKRLSGERRDFAVPPPAPTLLDRLVEKGMGVLGIGKIEDIFSKCGITHAVHTGTNLEGLMLTLDAIEGRLDIGPMAIRENAPTAVNFIFTNLVDTDMLFGHRRDARGYATALIEIDEWVGHIMGAMKDDDILIITSDHGNDPTAPGTDHTREFVPLLCFSRSLKNSANDLGTRKGFVDVAASLAAWFGLEWTGPGVSFIPELSKVS